MFDPNLLAKWIDQMQGWPSGVLPSELSETLRGTAKRLTKAEKILKEVAEPGVFGGYIERPHLVLPEDPAVFLLCERHGYGAVMDSAQRQWAKKCPGQNHTVAACASVRIEVLAEIAAFFRFPVQRKEPK